MNDWGSVVVITLGLVLATVGTGGLIGDYRHFDTLTEQCKTQGYIQNKTTRIVCSIEEKSK